MMLSATSDHAIRAVLVLARASASPAQDKRTGEVTTIRADEIADAIGAPRNYLAKTLNVLAKEGIVTSARGPLGGFSLAMPATELTLARIVDCFDEPRPQLKCLLGTNACDMRNPCAAHHRWTEVKNARRAPLCNTTVADLLGQRVSSPAAGPGAATAAMSPAA